VSGPVYPVCYTYVPDYAAHAVPNHFNDANLYKSGSYESKWELSYQATVQNIHKGHVR